MEAIALFFNKFSDELIGAQIAMLSLSLCLGIYWMLIRKKKRETSEWVPAALVKAYLDRMHADEHQTRVRLFGEGFAGTVPMSATGHQAVSTSTVMMSNDPALAKEIEALRSQLSMADQRAMEFDRMMNGLRAEKSALEQKLRDALAAQPAAAGAPAGPNPAQQKEIEDLKAKLQEYEVIEDDLANLKKFQKENEQLRQKVDQLEKGGAVAGAAAAPVATTVIPADAPVAPALTVVPATAAPVAAPAASSPELNTNVLQPITPGAEAPAAPEKSSKQKEEELLSEFEKMLAS